jgi:hypothetical protein
MNIFAFWTCTCTFYHFLALKETFIISRAICFFFMKRWESKSPHYIYIYIYIYININITLMLFCTAKKIIIKYAISVSKVTRELRCMSCAETISWNAVVPSNILYTLWHVCSTHWSSCKGPGYSLFSYLVQFV